MKKINNKVHVKAKQKEQGMALILTMMCLMLCTSLGLAVLFNSTGEAALSGGFMRNEQAFYAADAGIGVAREAIRKELNTAITNIANPPNANPGLPPNQMVLAKPTRQVTVNGTAYQIETLNANQLSTALATSTMLGEGGTASVAARAAVAQRLPALTNANFSLVINVQLVSNTNTGVVDLQNVQTIGGVTGVVDLPLVSASATAVYQYSITSSGNNNVTGTLNNANATAREVGMINITLQSAYKRGNGGGQRFSEFGTFLNRWNGTSVWSPGVFQGRVHSNESMRFSSGYLVSFLGEVSQADTSPNYYHDNNPYLVSSVLPNSTPKTGITVGSTYTTGPAKPPPPNSFAQELSVLNSTGSTDATFINAKPQVPELRSVLRDAANAQPVAVSAGTAIADGVYVPTSGGTSITGGGIYVKGNVSEMKLSISGASQVYTIKQGAVTTTVTITPPTTVAGVSTPGQTVITKGSSTTTYTGVPMNKTSEVPTDHKPGVSLYVDGSISNMHGPDAVSGNVPAAISKNTSLTITAASDMQLTGSITYEEPVLTNTPSTVTYPAGYTPTNVLGLFTNAGKIVWKPNATYTETNASMTVDAAMAIFNEAALTADSTLQTGGWTTDCSACNNSTKITLRGSRSASKGVSTLVTNGEKTNRFYDPRFGTSQIFPPFFPSTANVPPPPGVGRTLTISTTNVQTIANTWQRTYS